MGSPHKVPPERQARVCACGSHGFVPLTRGRVALVDAADVPLFDDALWHTTGTAGIAAARKIKGELTLMHRFLMRAPKGKDVDHRNHDTLDNRRDNLRVCSHADNQKNQRRRVGFKGVSRHGKKWRAEIRVKGRLRHLGMFPTERAAAAAFDAAAVRFHGEFALTNEMLDRADVARRPILAMGAAAKGIDLIEAIGAD